MFETINRSSLFRAKITINAESDKVEDVRANTTEVEDENFLTISKIVEQKQIFEKRLKYRKVIIYLSMLGKGSKIINNEN